MRRLIPGPYTFILPATKAVPKVVMEPKRKTTGIRIPNSTICQAILGALGNPVISTSAHFAQSGEPPDVNELPPHEPMDAAEFFDRLDGLVDGIVTVQEREAVILEADQYYQVSTILDLTDTEPIVIRQGLGWQALEETGLL
jgi:tRNA threonylcarbamoyl adenosine modification protein (Sua5/YciO/YrdC/YwlC family)